MYMKSQIFKEQSIENLLKQIILFDPRYQDESYILLRGEEIGYNLYLPRIVIIIDFYQFEKNTEQIYNKAVNNTIQSKVQYFKQEILKIINNTMKDTRDIIAPFLEDKFVILSTIPELESELEIMNAVKEKCKKMIAQFKQKKISIKFGIGIIGKGVVELQESYHAARRALELGVKRFKNNEIYYFYDFVLEDLTSYAKNSLSHKYISQLLTSLKEHPDWKELAETICAWCESGFRQKNAASILYIHRNTLYHRLNKIHQITKLDPMNFKEIHLLYLGIIMNLGNNE